MIPRLLEITFLAIVFRCGLGTESLFCGAITKVDRSRKFMDFTTSVSENMEMPMYGNISPIYSITYRSRHWLTVRYDFVSRRIIHQTDQRLYICFTFDMYHLVLHLMF